jgi:argininosuccinate synthase
MQKNKHHINTTTLKSPSLGGVGEIKAILLAYSGGLDTSFCVKYLTEEKGYTVHCAVVNTGGFSENDLVTIADNAKQLGAASFKILDAQDEYYEKFIKYLVFGNVLRNNTYPLSVSAERTVQALSIIAYAKELGVSAVAHGSTGAGNDQVRFDLIFNVLGGNLEIITPIRDLKLSRQAEIDYLQIKGVNRAWEKAKYSVNKGLWGTSVGGAETLTSDTYLPESAFPTPVNPEAKSLDVTLHFEKGELRSIDNQSFTSTVEAIKQLNDLASPFGIGRDIHVGDTIIGIKGRVGFEAAAPLIILKAHHLLEKHTLSKWQQYWKEQLANWYGMFLHEGQYLDPVMRNIETFLEDTQPKVTGKVYVKLYPYRFELQGITSENDLMQSSFGQYGEMNNAWTGDDVKGFTKILSNAISIQYNTKF